MGWQPIAAAWAVRRWMAPDDLALRPASPRVLGAAIVAVLLGAALATSLALVGRWTGVASASASFNGTVEVTDAARPVADALAVALGGVAALLLLALQALGEELGFRGHLLPTAMRAFGRVRGLTIHAVLWGLWYAPVVFSATYVGVPSTRAFAHCAAFTVTCSLVGMLLGWLRLASGSLAPPLTANLTLTLVAGTPYLLHGLDAGLRSAILQPVGWVVLVAAVATLLRRRFRDLVRLPPNPAPLVAAQLTWLAERPRDRTLH